MPKIVDHEKRRIQIAEATWRVIIKEGIEGATVRNIAKEAGISLGALRHYFSTQDELLIYAMKLVKERATKRISEIAKTNLPPREKVLQILLQMVPIDEDTNAEMEVWLAFIGYAKFKKQVYLLKDDGVFEGINRLVYSMKEYGLLKKEVDVDLETERLYALIDGIAIHAIFEPLKGNKNKLHRLLSYHVDSICN